MLLGKNRHKKQPFDTNQYDFPDQPSTDATLTARFQASCVSQNAPERPPTEGLVGALDLGRNARLGFGFGALLAVALLFVFVYLPGSTQSPALYLLLAFVVAFTAGLLATTLLVAVTVWRLARNMT